MARSIYIENVPDALYERLQQRAAADNRSLDSEILALLEHAIAGPENGAGESEEERLDEIFRRASEWSGPYEWFPEGRTDVQGEPESGTLVPNKMIFWRQGANLTAEEYAVVWARIKANQDALAAKYGPFPDSIEDIRAIRAERESREWR
jgi:plasmid stability protein